jgi:predicted transcriptional regulator
VRRVLEAHGISDAVVSASDRHEKSPNHEDTAHERSRKRDAEGGAWRNRRPNDAASSSVESTEALLRLLRDAKPQSVAELARLTNRAEPNLLRTLNKLEAFGLVEMRTGDGCRR